MRAKNLMFLFLIFSFFALFSISTNAKTVSSVSDSVYLLVDDGMNSVSNEFSEYDQSQSCSSLLGDPNDENSVAWLLQVIFDILKVVGPLLVIVLSSIDFAKVIIQSDDESMGKAKRKLIYRLILAVLLFFVPILLEVMLDLFGFVSECGIQ